MFFYVIFYGLWKVINTNLCFAFFKNIFVITLFVANDDLSIMMFPIVMLWRTNYLDRNMERLITQIKLLLCYIIFSFVFLHENKLYSLEKKCTNKNNLGLSQIVIWLLHDQFKEKVSNCFTGKLWKLHITKTFSHALKYIESLFIMID